MTNACFLDEDHRQLGPLKRLLRQYTRDGIVLFLGAGVSVESGIPNWDALADALLLKALTGEGLEAVKRALPSHISRFEFAGKRLGTRRFVEELYAALYGGMGCKSLIEGIPVKRRAQETWVGWQSVADALGANRTLAAIGDLLILKEGAGFRRNPQVHSVLTSNADNLLELYCMAKTGGRHALNSVDRASVGDHPNQTPIYHLHGFLDARSEIGLKSHLPAEGESQAAEFPTELLPDLIFRESDYYRTIASPSSFVNHTPQSLLRRLNAVFVGTTLEDLNMRRWLYDAFRERTVHRAKYLRQLYQLPYDAAEDEAAITSRRHFWLRTKAEADKADQAKRWDVPHAPVDEVMAALGIQVVWCDSYVQLQERIDWIRSKGTLPTFGRASAEFRRS